LSYIQQDTRWVSSAADLTQNWEKISAMFYKFGQLECASGKWYLVLDQVRENLSDFIRTAQNAYQITNMAAIPFQKVIK
jgi:hypothetical protein